MAAPIEHGEPRLPFPTRPLQVGRDTIEAHLMPADRKQEVLEQLHPFDPVPSLDEPSYDLRKGRPSTVRELRVTREKEQDYSVSPHYSQSCGTVIDWMPREWAEKF